MTSVTFNEAKAAVLERFVANTTLNSANYTFDNEAYTPPDAEAWARVTLRERPSTQGSLGPVGQRKFDRRGVLFIQIMTPAGQGTSEGDLLASSTAAIFEGTSFSGLRFTAVTIRSTGRSGSEWVTLVEAAFDYQETK